MRQNRPLPGAQSTQECDSLPSGMTALVPAATTTILTPSNPFFIGRGLKNAEGFSPVVVQEKTTAPRSANSSGMIHPTGSYSVT